MSLLAVTVLLKADELAGSPRERKGCLANGLPDDNRELEPPDPIPNSEVKRLIADGSVGLPHVRVCHRQALIPKPRLLRKRGFLFAAIP